MADATPLPKVEAPLGLRAHLAARRAQLLQRSAELRERLALHAAGLQPAFSAVDTLRGGWRWLRRHPWLPLALGVWWMARRPRRVGALAMLAWRAWRSWQRLPPRWRRRLIDRIKSAPTTIR
ncbi:YqjK family protein [Tepidimonas alkaliphilus]|uniref:YqjK family protein n=1 Tax=Tepidimonas alkaliphilus TaxID=2588942 RepID=UPI00163D8B7E|nr:YqjK family protein [Tepidimonas alkaliphilus]